MNQTAAMEEVITKNIVTNSDLLVELVNKFEAAVDATTESRRLSEQDIDYYHGDQWDAADRKILKDRKQPCLTINRCKPKVDFLLGLERKQRNDPKAFPRTPNDEDSANAATDGIRYVLDDNQFDAIRSAVFYNMLVPGAAGGDVSVKPTKKPGEYRITVQDIAWDRMFWDPHSMRDDFRDANYKGQVVWMDEADARAKWPAAKLIFDETYASEATADTHDDKPQKRWVNPERKRVRIVEMWCKRGAEIIQYVFTKAGFLQDPVPSPYVDEEGNAEDPLEFVSAFTDRDGNRYGIIRNWIGIQEEINKRRSKALHIMSVRQFKSERGAVDDVEKARAEAARPDGWIEFNPGMEIELLETGDMAAAQFQLLQEAKQEIDAVGANAALSGTESRVMSGRALIARQEGGMAELGPVFDQLRLWQLRVYRKICNRIRQYWNEEKWIRVTDDEKNPRHVGLNQKITRLQAELERAEQNGGVPPELQQLAQMPPEQIAQIAPEMLEVVQIKNNTGELDVDIILSEVPDTVAIQAEQFEKLAGLAQSGVPIPPEALIEASGLRNKDKILEKMGGGDQGMPPQVAMQIQQAQEQMQAAAQQIAEREEAAKAQEQQMKEAAHQLEVRMLKVQAEETELALKQQIAELKLQMMGQKIVQQAQPQAMQ